MNPNDAMVVVLKDILLCWLGFRFIYIVWISWYYIRYFKCVTTTNMLVFLSACLSCLPVCRSNFNGWFRSQGKHRSTLEFKSSGCAVITLFMTQVSVCQSQSNSQSYKVAPPFLQGGGGCWASNQILKRGGLTGP